MDEEVLSGGGMRTFLFLIACFLCVLILLAATRRSNTSFDPLPEGAKSNSLVANSGNEEFSRNQANVNLLGYQKVENTYNTCIGTNSCVTIAPMVVITNSTTTTTNVNGDRNSIIGSDGVKLCEDPVTKIMTPSACGAQP